MQRQCERRPHARRSTWVWIGTSLALGSAIIALVVGTSVIAASSDPSSPSPATLGEKLFADASLSASGAMSCATCHDPAHAREQSNDLPVQVGGQNLDVLGFRAVPSLQ